MELNPYAHEFHQDPYPVYRHLRDHAPVYRNDELDFYALTRFADVAEAMRDHETFISGRGTVLEMMGPDYEEALDERPMILFLDPPRHDVLRALVTQAFTPRHLKRLEDDVRETTQHLVEDLAADGGGDFVEQLAALLPMHVIFELLGVPEQDRLQLRTWTDQAMERLPEPPWIPESAIEAGARSSEYYTGLLAERRAHLGEDLISDLLRAEVPDEDTGEQRRMTDGEILGFVGLLGGAGNETVTKLLGNAAVLLHRHPDQRRAVVDDPGRVPDVVEETLRYWAPAQYNGRTLARDVTLHGVTMPEGAKVLVFMAAANRDERAYPEPDAFDIDRADKRHIAFGTGIHFCLGAQLARMEGRMGLEEFLARFPEYEVDEERLERVHSSNVQGFASIPFAA